MVGAGCEHGSLDTAELALDLADHERSRRCIGDVERVGMDAALERTRSVAEPLEPGALRARAALSWPSRARRSARCRSAYR
jgi:hypothetical protein